MGQEIPLHWTGAIQWPLVIQAITIHCITPCIPWHLPLEWDEGSSLAPSLPGLWFGSDWTGCHHKLSHVYTSWIQHQPIGIQVFLSREIHCTDDVLAVSKSSQRPFRYMHTQFWFLWRAMQINWQWGYHWWVWIFWLMYLILNNVLKHSENYTLGWYDSFFNINKYHNNHLVSRDNSPICVFSPHKNIKWFWYVRKVPWFDLIVFQAQLKIVC